MTRRSDWLIFSCIIVLFIFSSFFIFSLAPNLLRSQLIFIFLGLIIFWLFSRLDYQIFRNLSLPLLIFSLVLLIASFIFGSRTRETFRWIRLGTFSFQPSELVKPLLILALASFVSSGSLNDKKFFLSGFFFLIPAFLIFLQPDLGSALIMILSWLTISFYKINRKQILFLAALLIVGLLASWFFMKSYQKDRFYSFLSPRADPLGEGYQLIQAMITAGSGKFLGRGLLRGTQSQLRFLPEKQSDFIYASLSEELGFLGSATLLLVYFLLLNRTLVIAKKAPDEFGTLICLGVFALLFAQTFINIGMNLGLLPITGITLPLVSAGGSSLISLMISLGLVESVTRKTKIIKSIEIK